VKESVLELFQQHPELSTLISVTISIVIAVLGLVPSFFVTAANILFFGFRNGLIISIAGEAIGAVIAFLLYRKGFRKTIIQKLSRFPQIQKLIEAQGQRAFWLILSLRLIPFVPSGLVTFAAAIGKVSAVTFVIASTLGKIPALFMEAYSVYEIGRFSWQGKIILVLIGAGLIFFLLRKSKEA